MNNRFGKLVQNFLTSYIIGECNYSNNTKASYSSTFYLFVQYLNVKCDIKPNSIEIESIDKNVIINFLNWLEDERDASISTRNQRLASLKSFYKYVQLSEPDLFNTCSQILSIKNKKISRKIISYFKEDEIKIMIDYLNSQKSLKYLTIICVLYETGARVSELINIKLNDLNLSENASIKLYGKGNKVRIVPISKELVALINKYIKEIYVNYNDFLFFSNQKKQYNRKSVNYIINKVIKELNALYPSKFNQNYSPHSFRHSKGTHLYNNGTPLLYIKDFLGHSTITTTEIYATPDTKKQREQILNNAKEIKLRNRYTNEKKENLENWLKSNMK